MIWSVIPVKTGVHKFWMPDHVRHDIRLGALVVAPPSQCASFNFSFIPTILLRNDKCKLSSHWLASFWGQTSIDPTTIP